MQPPLLEPAGLQGAAATHLAAAAAHAPQAAHFVDAVSCQLLCSDVLLPASADLGGASMHTKCGITVIAAEQTLGGALLLLVLPQLGREPTLLPCTKAAADTMCTQNTFWHSVWYTSTYMC